MNYRIGQGYDVHKLSEGRKLILGGIEIPSAKGCIAHSDGDVLIHAICDALFGAASLGDIGKHFPDSDPGYKNISSTILLRQTLEMVSKEGFSVVNIDSTICLQSPKLKLYKENIKESLIELIGVQNISVKATTTEEMGFIGEGKGISVYAIVLLEKL
ncbi:MAG: 2-C-methyl-D-erythritol 2,4-cyclodiphosphate synthase [Bacteroidales bacterium]